MVKLFKREGLLQQSMLVIALSLANIPISIADDIVGSIERSFEARVLIRASSRIEYRNEIVAPIKEASFLAGQQFKKGDRLIQFDCSRYDAERKAASASANAAAIEHNTKKRLLKYQAAGKNEVSLAAAKSAEAQAQLEVHKVRNQSCEFKAPYDGRVVEVNAEAHEFPPADRPLIIVINDSALEMELVVPSVWLRWLKPQSQFEINIDETGENGIGKVERIAAEVDPVSQTVKVIASFDDRPASVLAGMSGTVNFINQTN